MMLDLLTVNKAKKLIKEEVTEQLKEVWNELDRINNKLMVLEEENKILMENETRR